MTKRKFYLRSLYWLLAAAVLGFIGGALNDMTFSFFLAPLLGAGWAYFVLKPAIKSECVFSKGNGPRIAPFLGLGYVIVEFALVIFSWIIASTTIGTKDWMQVALEKFSGYMFTDGYDMFITPENDVYVVGNRCYKTSLSDCPMLWINGQPQEIGKVGNANFASNVFVQGSNVYATVYEVDRNINYLWHNGKISLSSYHTFNSLFVKDNDVYIVGDDFIDDEFRPAMWKNGEKQFISDQRGVANSIFIDEDKVYIAGTLFNETGNLPVLWIDNELNVLAEEGSARAVCVKDDNVYVIGSIKNDDKTQSALWTNGEVQYLNMEEPKCITVANDKIYIGGGNGYHPNLWISGEDVSLPENLRYYINSIKFHNGKLYFTTGSVGPSPLWTFDGTSFENVPFNK